MDGQDQQEALPRIHMPEAMAEGDLWESYAGVLAGVYGTPEEARAYLRGEQETWDE